MFIKVRLILCRFGAEGIITFQDNLLQYPVSLYCDVYSKISDILISSSFNLSSSIKKNLHYYGIIMLLGYISMLVVWLYDQSIILRNHQGKSTLTQITYNS